LEVLKVERIDHGVRCEESLALVRRLASLQIPLTVCPLSNVKLKVFASLESHNLGRLMKAGLRVTVNSDDPTQFGGYINDNLIQCQRALRLTREDLFQLATNSFLACFVSEDQKRRYLGRLEEYRATQIPS
jgi:adenosine deaminase